MLIFFVGAEVKMSRPREDKNPVVIGRLGRNEGNPTVTFYGHYDVQPAMEREWATDPFLVHAQDGYLYGRGTSDNKVSSGRLLDSPDLFAMLMHETTRNRIGKWSVLLVLGLNVSNL